MGTVAVDQIAADGALFQAPDSKLSDTQKNALLLAALPEAWVDRLAGERVLRFHNQVMLKKQITHLGYPWPEFKKRIQIPRKWVDVHQAALDVGLTPRFIGIYHYGDVTIFVDFDPSTYVRRKANNSAAHVATNDLYQAQTLGQFSRVDRNGNRLTSVRSDQFEAYLRQGYKQQDPRVRALDRFNSEFLTGQTIAALEAVQEMHRAAWPDRFQGEWPGFYLEYRLDAFLRSHRLRNVVQFQKEKRRDTFDCDLAFMAGPELEYYGDLKSSDVTRRESPGNDAEAISRCVAQYGRFWYVIYEHETRHARDNSDLATIAWNEWKRSVGYERTKGYDPLSYARRFKETVRFVKMSILEVNEANFKVVLGDFAQGRQPDGAARALKVMINKRNVDNFLIYSRTVPQEVPRVDLDFTPADDHLF